MHENLARIKIVCEALADLQQDFVFVGGAVVSLYVTNPDLASEVRPTMDVDVLVELVSYFGYAELDERLRNIGFINDTDSLIICRYIVHGVVVDIMPTDSAAIGFSNRWYAEGFEKSIVYEIDENTSIKIFSLPYFIASKWEAFKSRGNNDYRSSKDFEDIVYILQNSDDFEQQILDAPKHLVSYLKSEFSGVLYNDDFTEGLYANLSWPHGVEDVNHIRLRLSAALGLAR
ncbi:MAG: nucleotidyl transferase AbiEii/AbiGii toxin family protein [Bacteroidota bacterium]